MSARGHSTGEHDSATQIKGVPSNLSLPGNMNGYVAWDNTGGSADGSRLLRKFEECCSILKPELRITAVVGTSKPQTGPFRVCWY